MQYDWHTTAFELIDCDEIKDNCQKFEVFLNEYYDLLSQVKIEFGEDYEDYFPNSLAEEAKEGGQKGRPTNFLDKAWSTNPYWLTFGLFSLKNKTKRYW